MSRYESRDVSFDVPRHWEDRTMVAFAATPRPGQSTAPNVVMTRDVLSPEETLVSYADKQLAELGKRLEGFELKDRKERTLGGQPGIELHFTWRAQSGELEQRLAMALGRRRTVFCFNATAAKVDADQMNPLFDRILSTVRFPRPGEEA
ncbi:DUF1795 domain-containing protein [Polyangium sp. 15x6]|uniref:DUF1795 domain-containing protein n=1 Tax=Polyangium sp. 15x6 TaxID=3042687 RepID=UPI00249A54AD|nr:DUF1795 domain-containing protein [Polyangium sp. 15x6]MDI3284287.1 DUF1795 domain-containing protein [Polyangium sp. 15x6]